MSTKLFVGRLAEGTTNEDILNLFTKYGTVTECTVLGNYGFIHMSSESEAKAALAELDGYGVRGNHIHVELSTPGTQGRKKRMESGSDRPERPGRYEPYPPPRHEAPQYRAPPPAPERERPPAAREEFASEQVKDLLELYFRDPYAFDQYAKTYYYGERAERERARAAASYYPERRPDVVYAPGPPRGREEDMLRAGVVGKPSSGYPGPVEYGGMSRSSAPIGAPGVPRSDDRYRSGVAMPGPYPGGRI